MNAALAFAEGYFEMLEKFAAEASRIIEESPLAPGAFEVPTGRVAGNRPHSPAYMQALQVNHERSEAWDPDVPEDRDDDEFYDPFSLHNRDAPSAYMSKGS